MFGMGFILGHLIWQESNVNLALFATAFVERIVQMVNRIMTGRLIVVFFVGFLAFYLMSLHQQRRGSDMPRVSHGMEYGLPTGTAPGIIVGTARAHIPVPL